MRLECLSPRPTAAKAGGCGAETTTTAEKSDETDEKQVAAKSK
jgi:hypothetical protein